MKKYIIAAGAYKGLTKEEWEDNQKFKLNFEEIPVEESELSRLSKIVFAPGVDGNPTSDISFYLSCGDDGFKEYMKNMLLKEHEGTVVSDDPETAGQTVKKNLWTYKEYFNQMDNYIHEQMRKEE